MSVRREPIDERRRALLAAMGAFALGFELAPARAAERVPLRMRFAQGAVVPPAVTALAAQGGGEVTVDLYADAPALYPKVQAADATYDVVVAAERVVARMIFANLLQNIDPKLVPNLRNIDAAFA